MFIKCLQLPKTILNVLFKFPHLILIIMVWNRYCYGHHFTDEDTEVASVKNHLSKFT